VPNIVVIGASAGGVDALRGLVRGLPPDLHMLVEPGYIRLKAPAGKSAPARESPHGGPFQRRSEQLRGTGRSDPRGSI